MKTFTVCYGADVSCYGTFEIEARDEAHALEVARKAFDEHTHELEPEWESGFENCRIVNINDEEGDTFHEGEDVYPNDANRAENNGYELFQLVKRLNQWAKHVGGWDAPVWRDVEAIVERLEQHQENA